MKACAKYLFYFFTTIVLQGCGVETTEWDFEEGDNGKLVVEALLSTEYKRQEVRLSLSYNDWNEEPTMVSGASVSIGNGIEDILLEESPEESGLYRSAEAVSLVPGILYQLNIEWQDKVYTASNQMVYVFPISPMGFQQVNDSDSMVLSFNTTGYSPTEQSMYVIDIDWTELSGNEDSKAQLRFYIFNSLDVSGVFKPAQEPVYFPKGSKVFIRKYGLNDGYADFLRALVMETEWQGGLFDDVSSNLPSNISNGGLGYFAVCAMRMDSLVAE
ncbi:MAG TPA: DUF4249 domain-containing protein [Phaeodactylibacter sp.]|nr:DUF4249 domain-containing protein [Phaeodactylibacter sp.]